MAGWVAMGLVLVAAVLLITSARDSDALGCHGQLRVLAGWRCDE